MSKIALTPNPSGTGVFTIASPATNTDRTLTLPDEAGTVLTSASSLASANLTGTVTVSGSNVGIGESSVDSKFHVKNSLASTGVGTSSSPIVIIQNERVNTGSSSSVLRFDTNEISGTEQHKRAAIGAEYNYTGSNFGGRLMFSTADTSGNLQERLRIDSSGNVIVGPTSSYAPVSLNVVGVSIRNFGEVQMSSQDQGPLYLNRKGTDGTIVTLRKENVDVGSIGTASGKLTIGTGAAGLIFNDTSRISPWNVTTNSSSDGILNFGEAYGRWKDIYATNGTIQTSDRNEKQDIDVMSEAETRVAAACKGLMRKFRFIDAVEAKGDDARIHFGIIAQDLQDAFAAEGLDASRYAMFCSDTWWEAQTDIPAVEAVDEVLDEDGNVVTEAVEAKDAYTRTDTYETLEEAPEGATERTRLGVRYSELLAFIIGAM